MSLTQPETNSSGAILQITDLEGDENNTINFGLVKYGSVIQNNVQRTFSVNQGWNIMSCPFFMNSLVYGHNSKSGYSSTDIVASNGQYNAFELIKNHLYEFESDTVPIHYKYLSEHANGGLVGRLEIFKDYLGALVAPQFNFNGIGNFDQAEGYQYKIFGNYFWKFKGTPLYNVSDNSIEVSYTFSSNGWILMSFPYLHEIDAEFFFQELVNQNLLIIVKDFLGAAYLPAYNFNGIGNLKPGQGYQLKLQNI